MANEDRNQIRRERLFFGAITIIGLVFSLGVLGVSRLRLGIYEYSYSTTKLLNWVNNIGTWSLLILAIICISFAIVNLYRHKKVNACLLIALCIVFSASLYINVRLARRTLCTLIAPTVIGKESKDDENLIIVQTSAGESLELIVTVSELALFREGESYASMSYSEHNEVRILESVATYPD